MDRHPNRIRTIHWISLIMVIMLAGCATLAENSLSSTSQAGQIVQSVSYIAISDDEMARKSQWIVVGKVDEVSATRWNQDSGEEWKNDPDKPGEPAALQIHQIRLLCEENLVGGECPSREVTLTVIGPSPLEPAADYALQAGDRVVAFLQETDLAWREGGSKRVLYLAAAPFQALYVQGADGLFRRAQDEGRQAFSLEQLRETITSARQASD